MGRPRPPRPDHRHPALLVAILGVQALLLRPPAAAAAPSQSGPVLETIVAERIEADGRFHPLPHWVAPGRPTLALALSGGGARGIAHLGVLQAMREDGVELDALAGTSVGALLGAFVCSGFRPEEVQAILTRRDWDAIVSGLDDRNRVLTEIEDVRQSSPLIAIRLRRHRLFQIGALLQSRLLERELYRYLLKGQLDSGGDFDRLRYRFRPVATDILSGKAVIPDSGDLVSFARGSFAIPGVFRPVPAGDALLVDGGLVENVPVLAARTFGTDVVAAVDVSESLRPSTNVKGALDLLNRSVTLMIDARTRESLAHADVVLVPEVQDFSVADFGAHVADLVRAGREAYARERGALWKALESHARDRSLLEYGAVEVKGTTWIAADEIARRLGGAAGKVTRFRVASELARALNAGPFSSGKAEWIAGPAGRRLLFSFEENPVVRRVVLHGPPETLPPDFAPTAPLNRPFSLDLAEEVLSEVREALIERGHVLVDLGRPSWEPASGTLAITVSEAEVGTIETEVRGEVRLEPAERFLQDLRGTRFALDRLADRLDEMTARGAIFEWSLNTRASGSDAADLSVELRGDDYYEAALGGAYRGAFGWAGFLRMAKANISGRGDVVDLTVVGARETTLLRGRYRTEYGAFLPNLGAEVGLDYFENTFPLVNGRQELQVETEDYRGDRAWVSLIRRLRWGAVVQAGFFNERERLDSTPTLPADRLERTSAFLRLDLDRRDRLLFPTRGGSLRITGEREVSGDPLWKAELRANGTLSAGTRDRQTLTLDLAFGLSEDASRRPFWFDPGGYRDLYGFIPYGAAAPEYARAGAAWRLRLFDVGAARIYLEAGADVVRTALERGQLASADDTLGYGMSLIAHTRLLGPVAIGAARNDAGARMIFLTAGFPFLRD